MTKKLFVMVLISTLSTGVNSILISPAYADDHCIQEAKENWQECYADVIPETLSTGVGGAVTGALGGGPVLGLPAAAGGALVGAGAASLNRHVLCGYRYVMERSQCPSGNSSSMQPSNPQSSYSPYTPEYWRDTDGDQIQDQSYDPSFYSY